MSNALTACCPSLGCPNDGVSDRGKMIQFMEAYLVAGTVGQELVPHYSPEQLLQLVDIFNVERSSNDVESAARVFATLGKTYKEVFIKFCARSLNFHPIDADLRWKRALESDSLRSATTAIEGLIGWAHEDDKNSCTAWLKGCIPRIAWQKYQEGDRGLAEIAGGLLSRTLKATQTGKRIFYRYDASAAIWSKIADGEVKRLISHALESVLLKILDSFKFANNGVMIEDEEAGELDDEVSLLLAI